jgi:hypothetical protein
MTYQVVASHRTGSTLLKSFCVDYNDGFGFSELFLEPAHTHMSFLDLASMEEKFEFLEYYKKKDIHFSIKIFPKRIIDRGHEERLYNYLDGYKILTIRRDPFESFLSSEYQRATDWKIAHRKVVHGKRPENLIQQPFDIDYNDIDNFVKKWNVDYGFINKLEVYKIFDYNELTVSNLQKFFNTQYKPDIIPHNIDYTRYVSNLEDVRKYFNECVFHTLRFK